MAMLISHEVFFNAVKLAQQDVVAIGGEINAQNIMNAYRNGVFPWYNEGEELLWWCPLERFVLFPEKIKQSQSMEKLLARTQWVFTENKAFLDVIQACRNHPRKQQTDSWINQDLISAFLELQLKGFAKSYEVWENTELIGGFYGIDLGSVFCGESMFSVKNNASKAAFIRFAQKTKHRMIDCQVYSKHLESLGAELISKQNFLTFLDLNL